MSKGPLPFAFLLALATEAHGGVVPTTANLGETLTPGILSGLLKANQSPLKPDQPQKDGESVQQVQYFPNFPNFRNCFGGNWRNC
jgi:hypothetical protein